jgi:transposase
MNFITGFNRNQTVLVSQSYDQLIAQDNVVRFVDLFTDALDVVDFGFRDVSHHVNGRPPFQPKDLLKLYLYGYLNRIRSSRALEKECTRNIELIWLMKGLDKDGKNFMDELGFSDFHIDEIIEYIKNSTWSDIVKSNKQLNDADSIKRLVGSTMVKRNIAIKHSDDKYSFTKAYKLFIDFARELIKSELNQEQTN